VCIKKAASPDYKERQGDEMAIGFIGAGKAGFSLGKFFVQGGLPVTGYYSRHQESAQEAATFTGTKPYDALAPLIHDSDALFLTVPDGEIASVFQQLRQYELTGKQICHCSGAMTAGEAFPGLEQTGAYGYSIHPLFPISSKRGAYRELAGAFFCLEGEGPHLEQWAQRLRGLGPQVHLLPPDCKVRYHAACAAASNLVCALAQMSLELLEGCGFSQREALAALAPLMRSNLEHLLQSGPAEALTGPVERDDTATIAKHLACLSGENEALYRAASRKLVPLAAARHPDRDWGPMNQML